MISIGDALNERASYDDVARSITQVQSVFESLSDRVTGLIARVDMSERSLVESQSNHPAIGGVNLKIEDLSTRVCQIDRMMQDVEQCWTNNRDGIKWVKDQLYETQANLEIKSRDCKSYTDKQNTHNMAVSTTLNSKLEQMLEVQPQMVLLGLKVELMQLLSHLTRILKPSSWVIHPRLYR